MPLSYRNQSIDLLSKSLDWFLYDRDLRHERGKSEAHWEPSQMSNPSRPVHFWKLHWNKNKNFLFSHFFVVSSFQGFVHIFEPAIMIGRSSRHNSRLRKSRYLYEVEKMFSLEHVFVIF